MVPMIINVKNPMSNFSPMQRIAACLIGHEIILGIDVRHPRSVPSFDAVIAMYSAKNITSEAWKTSVEPQLEVNTVRLHVDGTETHRSGHLSYE